MKLERVVKRRWDVVAVCDQRGNCSLVGFLSSLEPASVRDGMLAVLNHVANSSRGPMGLPAEISKEVGDDIYEFRKGPARVLWFYGRGQRRIVVCTHGYVKKTQKLPKSEKDRALESRRAYLRAIEDGQIQMVTEDE